MSKKHRDQNRTGFLNTVDGIRRAENDVDLVLKAGRLKRHESHREPLTAADITKLVLVLCFALICCAALILGFLGGYYIPALIGVGVFALIGLFALAAASSI